MPTNDFVELGYVLVVEQLEDEHLAHKAALGVLCLREHAALDALDRTLRADEGQRKANRCGQVSAAGERS